ncbi:MucR family transcriptional regulator [Methylobacterium sp. DB1607]|nr:MucR family transcriptional regulator [Methylobacterium sp. DB1607]
MSNDPTETLHATAARIDLAAEIVMAYVGNNILPAASLPGLIGDVHAALAGLGAAAAPAAAAEPEAAKPTAAAIKKSITPDALISFIDGRPYSLLKRHLTKHGLNPHSYRARYGLPKDYPMTAPNYSEHRASIARASGLGRPGARAQQAAE